MSWSAGQTQRARKLPNWSIVDHPSVGSAYCGAVRNDCVASLEAENRAFKLWLSKFVDPKRAVPYELRDYLELVDWSGRAIVHGKRGRIPADLPPILKRLSINPQQYVRFIRRIGSISGVFPDFQQYPQPCHAYVWPRLQAGAGRISPDFSVVANRTAAVAPFLPAQPVPARAVPGHTSLSAAIERCSDVQCSIRPCL